MNCIYCTGDTLVRNSRPQARTNGVWRRRQCRSCSAIFTTLENVDLTASIRYQKDGKLVPFSRATLFASIYEACRHRETAAETADELTHTVIRRILASSTAVIDSQKLIEMVYAILRDFDYAAAVQYKAYRK